MLTGAATELEPAPALDFAACELSTNVSGELSFRCLAEPVSLVSFLSLEDREVRGFDVPSDAVLISGPGATFSSTILFFEPLLDCMELI